MRKINLAIFASGRGSNCENIINAIKNTAISNAEVGLIFSDKYSPNLIRIAAENNIPIIRQTKQMFASSEDYDRHIIKILTAHNIDMIILAGYLKILTRELTCKYANRILNIHPSLLPNFSGLYGLNVHKEVLKSKVEKTGCTVHIVTEQVDAGKILGQTIVEVESDDTPEVLAQRVLEQEHILYPRIIEEQIHEIFNENITSSN